MRRLALMERATILLVITAASLAVFLPQVLQYFRSPPATVYNFAEGFLPDYYQYLSWIKSGMEEHLWLSSRYTTAAMPSALVHPLFSVTGIIAGFFSLAPPIAYLLLRIVALLVFFFSLYQLIRSLYPSAQLRIISLLLLLTGTGWETITWSGHFHIISKYSLPPHHLLALAAWMGIIMAFAKGKILLSIAWGWALALLNPSIFLFGLVFLLTFLLRPLLKNQLLFFIGIAPIFLYNLLVLGSTPPWSIMYQRMLSFNPPTSLIDYLLSLGPLLPLSLWGAWKMRNRILIAWAYLPILLFPLVGMLPLNYSRLFQTYQYIPITLLAVAGIAALKKPLGTLIVVALVLYGSLTYLRSLMPQLKPHDLPYYNVFVPKSLLAAFQYLDALPTEGVILSGEYVSQMIPAFTRHRTLIGRDDVIADYYPLRDRVFSFLDGRMTEAEALAFVQELNITYVIFGVDTKPLDQLPTKNYPFLVPVFTNGPVTVVQTNQ